MKRHATMLLGLLLAFLMAAPAQAQTDVTIRDINAYPQATIDELNAAGAGVDPGRMAELLLPALNNESVRFTAVVLSNPRTSGLGTPDGDGFPSRVHVYVRDTSAVEMGNEGMGVQLVDGAYQTTGLLNAAPGDVITVVGTVNIFTGNGGGSMQVSPQTIELLGPYTDFNLPDSILDPVLLDGTSDINMSVGSNGEVQVNWSNLSSLNGQYVRLEGAAVQVRSFADPTRPDWLITSDGGTTVVGFYDVSLRYRNDRDGGYSPTEFNPRDINDDFLPPPPGASINIQGFLVFQGDDPFNRAVPTGAKISIAPIEDADLEVTASPPEASTPSKPAAVPTDADVVTVTSEVSADPSRTLASVDLTYFTSSNSTEQTVAMTDNGDGTFSADIPAQADGDFVIYSVSVSDNTGAEFTSGPQEYRVLNAGITEISQIQETSGLSSSDASPFAGLTTAMNITATVQNNPALNSREYGLQDDDTLAPNTGIFVNPTDELEADLQQGDVINITEALIFEDFGVTQLRDLVYTTVTEGGTRLPAKTMTTDVLQDQAVAEAHEGMLLTFDDAVVTSTNPDAPGGPFGEWAISSDGTAANQLRVDDRSDGIDFGAAQDAGTVFAVGERLDFLQGILWNSFGNYKLMPDDLATDVGAVINVATEEEGVPGAFTLRQNYPNPFNPATTIEYTVPATGKITLEVFDMLGRSVAVLVNGEQAVGTYTAQFDATHLASGLYLYRLTAGTQVQVKKMMLLK